MHLNVAGSSKWIRHVASNHKIPDRTRSWLPKEQMNIHWNPYWQLSKYKGLEIQVDWNTPEMASPFNFSFSITRHCDHAGVEFTFELLELLYFNVHFYDARHWDYEKKQYCSRGTNETY